VYPGIVSAVRYDCPKLARNQLFNVAVSLVSLISLNDICNRICLNLVSVKHEHSISLRADNRNFSLLQTGSLDRSAFCSMFKKDEDVGVSR
jgi:hypothetical protein